MKAACLEARAAAHALLVQNIVGLLRLTDDGPGRKVKTTDGREFTMSRTSAEPRGYLSVCQGKNGLVHLISSWNHYVFNLKWLQSHPPGVD